MVEVLFFEKPGCINNTRQKRLLKQSGHDVVVRDLLKQEWDGEGLRPYFGELPVANWFNRTAPAIKQGQVDPDALTEAQALDLMVDDPILIRRPLMRVGDEFMTGFDPQVVDRWIGLVSTDPDTSLEDCPRQED